MSKARLDVTIRYLMKIEPIIVAYAASLPKGKKIEGKRLVSEIRALIDANDKQIHKRFYISGIKEDKTIEVAPIPQTLPWDIANEEEEEFL